MATKSVLTGLMPFSAKPKKSLSQNFLINPNFRENLIKKIENYPEFVRANNILEIGPGNGELTEFLVKTQKTVLALEIDQNLAKNLVTRFENDTNFSVNNMDAFLEFQNPDILKQFGEFVLVSNLPFKVASRILVEMATFFSDKDFFVVMQREVCSKTFVNKKALTFFGAWINLFWQVKKIVDINPGSFYPKPKVVSTFVFGRSKNNPWLTTTESKIAARNLLKGLFSQPNKTVRNNLLTLEWSADRIQSFFDRTGLEANTRLTWENYEGVLQKLLAQS